MSLSKYSLWEVILASFSGETWAYIAPAILETLYMTAVSSLVVLVFGFLLGVLLTALNPEGLLPKTGIYKVLGWVINTLRSLPQVVMIVLLIPVSRLLVGKSYGTNSCIIAISACCIPMYARLVESSLLEISKGKIEAAKSIGSNSFHIISRVVIPETAPSLIRGFTVEIISVLSMTALAGMFGAGGIGDIAVRFGYQRFQHEKLFACLYLLIFFVQLLQFLGNVISKHILKKRGLL
ncbi:MAG: ABC transporter permease [Lachnospiraceae bacterium]|nr:ABC transporter permease [Lachnospiraceae bacterium]